MTIRLVPDLADQLGVSESELRDHAEDIAVIIDGDDAIIWNEERFEYLTGAML